MEPKPNEFVIQMKNGSSIVEFQDSFTYYDTEFVVHYGSEETNYSVFVKQTGVRLSPRSYPSIRQAKFMAKRYLKEIGEDRFKQATEKVNTILITQGRKP